MACTVLTIKWLQPLTSKIGSNSFVKHMNISLCFILWGHHMGIIYFVRNILVHLNTCYTSFWRNVQHRLRWKLSKWRRKFHQNDKIYVSVQEALQAVLTEKWPPYQWTSVFLSSEIRQREFEALKCSLSELPQYESTSFIKSNLWF